MKKLLLALALCLPFSASAQQPLTSNVLGQVQIPAQTVLGNSQPVAGPLNAIPFAQVFSSSIFNGILALDADGHIGIHGPGAPTYSSGCGGSVLVTGNDQVGFLQTSGTASTSCVITFNKSWGVQPICSPAPISEAISSLNATQTVMTFQYASGSNLFFGWICLGIE